MILAIDVGNTNIVIGCMKDEKPLFIERISTDSSKTELEYMVMIHSLLELYKITPEDIDGAIISSVVPALITTLSDAINKMFKTNPIIVGPGVKTGLNIVIDNPASTGADLIVDAVGGYKHYGAPLIMIDMGTATTMSVLDNKANYIGGIIVAGPKTTLNALVGKTALLPDISLTAPKKVIGTNTTDAMKSGLILGQAAMLDGMIDRMIEELGYEAKIVATGGLSGFIVPYCKHEIIYDNDLMLKGLIEIYKKNTSK